MTRLLQPKLALICAVAALASCSSTELTQIIVVVDTDLAVPAQVDAIRIEVSMAEMPSTSTAMLSGPGATELPVTLGLLHSGGPLGPFTVRASGRLGASEVV